MTQINPETNLDILNQNNADTMIGLLGIELIDFGPDYISAKMPVDARTAQPLGFLHGGASATLAETLGSIGSILCLDLSQQTAFGLELNINHIRSAALGETVYGTATALHLGRRTHVWEIKIHNEAKKLISTGRLTVMIIDH